MTTPPVSPATSSERAPALDALRGIALFGVLAVNLLTLFRVSLFEQFLPIEEQFQTSGGASSADRAVARIMTLGLEWKAFILFSLLFGIGLAAQRERTLSRGKPFGPYATRKLAMLLGIGLVHMFLVWNGDILMLYAIAGALTAPLLGVSTRALLAIAFGLFVVHVMPLPYPPPFDNVDAMRLHVSEARRIYGSGTFAEVLAFRVHEVRPIAALLLTTLPRTMALFLLGACAWRAGIFHGKKRMLVRVMAMLGLVIGGSAVWATNSGVDLGKWRAVASGWGAVLLALGYASTTVVLFDRERVARVLSILAPLGRTALTSYLTQSIVMSVVFYGWGLGLFNRLGEGSASLIVIVLFALQVGASTLWLRRYRFGPVEWLWRSFTYGARQPMRGPATPLVERSTRL